MADSIAVPNKQFTDSTAPDDTTASHGLAGWQATGLALAAASLAAQTGLGALVGAAISAPVVYALVRLRRYAPEAAGTAELVGSTLGRRATAFAGILQVTGYALIAVTAAQLFGSVFVLQLATAEPLGPVGFNHWLWSLWAAAALVVAAVLVFALPDRIVGGLAGVLALVGLLIYFYYGLAVIARGVTGTVPEQPVTNDPPTGLAAAGTLAVAAVALVGFEVVTARTRRSSSGWPMGLAIGGVAFVAVVAWWASQYSGSGTGSPDGSSLWIAVSDLYGDTAAMVVTVGTAMFVVAALLAVIWGISVVTARVDATLPSDAIFAGVVLTMVLLVIGLIQGQWTLGYVGGLMLLALYAVVAVASSRIAADSVVSWSLRLVMPVVFAAVVLLPLLWAGFSLSSLIPVLVAAALIAAAAAAAVVVTRRRPD